MTEPGPAPFPASAPARRLFTALATASAIASCYAVRQADPDLFGYLAYGRLFANERTPTPIDPFAYTSQGRPWVSFEYLSQVLLWLTYDRYGPLGLIALKCALGAVAACFLFVAVRKASDDPVVWWPVFVLCTVTLARYFVFRPQLFTFAFVAVFVATVFAFLLKGQARLWILPACTVVWANVHGGFVAGLGVVGLAIGVELCRRVNAGSDRQGVAVSVRPLVMTLAACVLASLVNPHGVRLWAYVITEVVHGTNRRYISEWQPASMDNDPWSFLAITLLGLVLIASAGVAWKQRLMVSGLHAWQWLAVSAPVVGAGYLSVRNVPLAAIWLGPVITLLGSAISRSAAVAAFKRLWLVVGAAAVVVVTLVVQFIAAQPRPEITIGSRALGSTDPCRAVAFLQRNGLHGKLYNPLWWGSYVTWKTFPAILVSMDGRNISLFSDEMVAENLRFYSSDVTPADIDVPTKYDSDFLLVPSDRAVLGMAHADSRWRQIYADQDAHLFVRADPRHAAVEPGVLALPPDTCLQVLTRE